MTTIADRVGRRGRRHDPSALPLGPSPSTMDASILAKFPDDDNPLGPLLGNLPLEMTTAVLRHLTPFERALFARASGSCFRLSKRSGLERAGSNRVPVHDTEMVASWSVFTWSLRHVGVIEPSDAPTLAGHERDDDSFRSRAAPAAASVGNVDMLEHLLDHDSSFPVDGDEVYARAAAGGHRRVIEWALDRGIPNDYADARACAAAARAGHLDLLAWLRDEGFAWDEDTCSFAAGAGRRDVVEWARDNGCDWDAETCSMAARNGHLELLRWLHAEGCPLGEEICEVAAMGGHLPVMRWALENGYPPGPRACRIAAESGRRDIIEWARDNGCEWDEDAATRAEAKGHVDLARWLRGDEPPRDATRRERATTTATS